MSSLNSLYVKTETILELGEILKKKGMKGTELIIAISDRGNKYGKNVSAYVSQSKEDRENKKEKFSVGYGNTFWTDGKITVVKREQSNSEISNNETHDELPF